MLWLLGAAVVGVGALLAFQPLINARAGGAAGHPIYGALFSVLVSTVTLAVVAGLLRLRLPDLRGLAAAPAWNWVGGVIGAGVVATLVLAGIGLTTLRQGHRWADQLSRGVADAAASAGPTRVADHPIVMTSNRLLPQLLYDDVDRYDWVAADADDLPGFAEQLASAGADTAVLVVPTGSDLPARLANAGWTVRAEDTPAVYDIFVLERPER